MDFHFCCIQDAEECIAHVEKILTLLDQEGDILAEDETSSMHPHDLYKLVQANSMADCGRDMNKVNLRFV